MEEINVVLLNLTYDQTTSGVNRYLENLVKELGTYSDIRVHQVTLLQKRDMFYHRILQNNGVVDAVVMLPLDMAPVVSGLYWMEKYARVVADLLTPCFQGMKNLIWHTHCINLSQLAVRLKQQAGGRILTHLHCIPWKFSVEQNEEKFNDLYEKYQKGQYAFFRETPLEELTYRVSDHIVCVTLLASRYLSEVMAVSGDRISMVYNGADEVGQSGSYWDRREETEILFVGRISKEKGVDAMLAALQRVWKQGLRFRLTLVGCGKNSYTERLKKEYALLNPDFRGNIGFEELKELYGRCTIGIIPSLHEQCSYVAIEMMMFGVPLVVSDVDGLSEIFTHGVNALKIPMLFDRKAGLRPDGNRFADEIILLLRDSELRQYLGREARRLYGEKFGSSRMGRETVEIYREMIRQATVAAVAVAEPDFPVDMTVVLPFRNAGYVVKRILAGLEQYVKCRYQVILINDASDDHLDYGKESDGKSNIRYVENRCELGIPACWDQGVALAGTEFVFLLDQWAVILEDVVTPVFFYCREHRRSLLCVQNRLFFAREEKVYRVTSIPSARGGAVDFSGIRGPLTLTWEFLGRDDYDKEFLPVPCVRGQAYGVTRDYYLYLHGMNGMTGEGFGDAFLSAKVWLEGGNCVLYRGRNIGRFHRASLPWDGNRAGLAYEKIVYARLLMGVWGEKTERAVKLHYSSSTVACLERNLEAVKTGLQNEAAYLSGIFTRRFEDLFNLNCCDGNRIYPKQNC